MKTATFLLGLLLVAGVYTQTLQPPTSADPEQAARTNLQMLINTHPDPEFTRDMTAWSKQGLIAFRFEAGPELTITLELQANNRVGVVVTTNYYASTPRFPLARRNDMVIKQLQLYALYVRIRDHFNGTLPMVPESAPPEILATYLWHATLAGTRGSWQLATMINRQDLIPSFRESVRVRGLELTLVEVVYNGLRASAPPARLKLYAPTWDRLRQEALKKLGLLRA